jgi:hypothetical protein
MITTACSGGDQPARHVGQVKQRLTLTVTVLLMQPVDRNAHHYHDEAVSYLHKFQDDQGNLFTWFSSRDCKVKPGHRLLLRGTVKSHETYRGTAETHLTRCEMAVLEWPGEQPPPALPDERTVRHLFKIGRQFGERTDVVYGPSGVTVLMHLRKYANDTDWTTYSAAGPDLPAALREADKLIERVYTAAPGGQEAAL